MAGAEYAHNGRSGSAEQGNLALEPHQGHRGRFGPQQGNRVRIKRDGQSRHTSEISLLTKPAEQPLVAAVNSVEVADGDNRPSSYRGKIADTFNRDHSRRSMFVDSAVALSQSESP
jgi:hypothetical protein